MPKSDTKAQPKVSVSIQVGTVTPYQRAIWKKWWAARIGEAKQESTK